MKKILIVDDAPDSRVIIKNILSPYNVEIIEACDGVEGWKLILVEKPDLILLDLEMPNKNGFEVLDDIQEEWLDVPIVIITGDQNDSTLGNCLSNGATTLVHKPIDKEVLRKKISEILSDIVLKDLN
ncbi:response regulator [Plebeiibacterium marinum]|uniref:Response regulator n=1 Tax=Plebeiibacterium marinum TaxID=2992111 RepID=A0AAE3MEU9_9BACT|nr:response regulator [Plebeiobacterium marinum]MCW3806286.1 response regulator [Plebeiobacterium marinum]